MKERKQRKQTIIIILLCILILLAGLALFFSLRAWNKSQACSDLQVSQDQSDYQNPLDKVKDEDAYTELMGFGRLELDLDSPLIYLINPPGNEVYLSFDVRYQGQSLYKSDLIEPGKMEDFDIYSRLDAGEHTLTYLISSYDLKDKSLLWSGVQQDQDIFIRK
ncbi:MAG: hypothetical protein K5648_06150 [Erysipelotrichaceae bacterium]|nr:hypothetical protein [Erysipelotrichaceae bacterium]